MTHTNEQVQAAALVLDPEAFATDEFGCYELVSEGSTKRRRKATETARAAILAAEATRPTLDAATVEELIRICNSAEHDANHVARKLADHPMRHDIAVLSATFKFMREKLRALADAKEDGRHE